jgi:hypothetical protein
MTVDDLLKPGEAELLKGSVHAAVCGLAVVCGMYNAAAWMARRERHLGVNAILYAGLAIWEAAHVTHHSRRSLTQRAASDFRPRERDAVSSLRSDRLVTPSWVDSPYAGASTAGHVELAS